MDNAKKIAIDMLDEIVERIVDASRSQRVILFGSAATGEMNSDSDIDILVLQSAPVNAREESVRLREALRGLRCPIDIIVMALERFEETKDVVGSIAYPANKYGKVLYEVA